MRGGISWIVFEKNRIGYTVEYFDMSGLYGMFLPPAIIWNIVGHINLLIENVIFLLLNTDTTVHSSILLVLSGP